MPVAAGFLSLVNTSATRYAHCSASGLAYPFPPSPARLFTQPLPKSHLRQRLCAKPQVPLVKSPAAWQPIPVRPLPAGGLPSHFAAARTARAPL